MNRRFQLVAVCLCVGLALTAAVGWRVGRQHPAARPGMYVAQAHCDNCNWEGDAQVPLGQQVKHVECPRCHAWQQGVEDLGGARLSTLVPRDAYDLYKARHR